MEPIGQSLKRNLLLGMLDAPVLAELEPAMEYLPLQVRDPIYEENMPIRYAYFPTEGVISMLASIDGAVEQIEVATVGNEGMAGLPLFLGAILTPGHSFVQVAGAGFRMAAEDFRRATAKASQFTRVLHRYTQALLVQISQSTACNRVHSVEERCARWLLMTRDRVEEDEFGLTQAFLGQMLGERRATVNLVQTMFQEAGFIRYSGGRISIVNRQGLETVACGCYRVVRDEYDRMLKSKP